MDINRQKTLQKAYDLLAKREHSRQELKYKLAPYCDCDVLLEEILNELSLSGVQSDNRFTEDFIRCSIDKGNGKNKIEHTLCQRGIEQDIIDTYLYSKQFDWSYLAEKVRIKKFGEKVPSDYKIKAKQCRFLYGRGFDIEIINNLFK